MAEPFRDELARRLSGFERKSLELGSRRAASVAFAIVAAPEPGFLLTRRPTNAPRHPGQFALPGGRAEPGEAPGDTARRELQEELGVALPESALLGCLDDYATRSGFVITPAVLWCGSDPPLHPDPGEVAEVYRVALEDLRSDDLVQEHEATEPGRPIVSLGLVGTRVFAPTAALILQFRELALFGRTLRVAHYDQPRFAWQ